MKKALIYITGILFTIAALALYGLTMRGDFGNAESPKAGGYQTQAGGVFESSHERAPYAFMRSLLRDHSVDISKELADFSSPDAGFIKDKFYSFFPIGISLLIMPLYILGSSFNAGVLGAYVTMPIIGLLCLLLLFLIARNVLRLPFWAALLAAFVFGFTTTSWSYTITIYQHIASTFAVLLGFYAVWKYAQHGKSSWLWALLFGLVYSTSIFVDYPNALLLAPLGIYFVVSSLSIEKEAARVKFGLHTSFFAMFVVFAVVTALHLYYNQTELGSWRKFHNTFPRYTTETYAASYEGSDAEAKKKEDVSHVFKETHLVNGSYELFFAPDKGVFFFSPILLLGLFGIYRGLKRKDGAVVALVSLIIANFFLYASFGDPWGGWAFGPRYVIPAMAILSLFVGLAVAEAQYKYSTRAIAFVLGVYSGAIALLGVVTSNLIPPKIEADYFHLKYGFLRNIGFLKQGISENFVYKHFLHQYMTLVQYYVALLSVLVVILVVIFLVLPFIKERENA